MGDKCQKCVGSLRLGKLVHIGYIHQELLPLLNQNLVSLSQFVYPLKKAKTTFVCDECGKVFLTKQHHATHIFSHTGLRPFQCSQCQKSVKSKVALKFHNRSHTGYRPFTCKVCDKTFSQSGNLRTHEKKHNLS